MKMGRLGKWQAINEVHSAPVQVYVKKEDQRSDRIDLLLVRN